MTKYKNKQTGEIAKLKGFGTSFHPSGKAITMVWVKIEGKEKAEFIPAKDFDNQYEVTK
jgi:hypothetical protein